ncbi:MAG: serine/threonine-protein kinase [Polyangiales bacterium]
MDDYRVLRCIGVGGMGSVYEAEHMGLGRRVALKTLNPEYAQDEDVRGRFLREGVAVARVRHPNIVGVSHVGTADGITYLVMDLLEGEDLADRLERVGAMPSEQAVSIVLAVASAIEAAHEAGVIHRDLKPANVFLERTRREEVPRVLDFGISKLTDRVGDTTRSVALLGSPHYMSPEQARSSKSVDWRTDQYAIGVMLFECLTGRRPFRGETIFELVYAITSTDPPSPASLVTMPSGLEHVVLRAMARDADARFASMRDLAMALIPFAPQDSQRRWQQEFSANAPDVRSGSFEVDKHAFIDTLASANREVPVAQTRSGAAPVKRFATAAAIGAAALLVGGVLVMRGSDAPRAAARPPERVPALERVPAPAPPAVAVAPAVAAPPAVAVAPAVADAGAPVVAAPAVRPRAEAPRARRSHRRAHSDEAPSTRALTLPRRTIFVFVDRARSDCESRLLGSPGLSPQRAPSGRAGRDRAARGDAG